LKLNFAEIADWEEAYTNLKAALGLATESSIPKLPRSNNGATGPHLRPTTSAPSNQTKRKAGDQDGDIDISDSTETSKRSKNTSTKLNSLATPANVDGTTDPQLEHARAAAAFIPFLTPESLLPPNLPTREEMEGVLLNLRKQALVEEYFGNEEEQTV
jgi:pre-mRNA-splicing factor ISY1